MNILTIIATEKIFLDNTWHDQFSKTIGEIQRIIVSRMNVESEDYQNLLNEFPNLKKHTPLIEHTFT